MSRWDALRPDRREPSTKKSSPKQRQPSARTDGGSRQAELTNLTSQLEKNNEEDVQVTLDRIDLLLKSKSDIPPKSLGDAVVMLITLDTVSERRRLDLASRTLRESNVVLTNRQVKDCLSSLTISTDPNRTECMAHLVLVAHRQMPAEDTARELVEKTFLPILEDEPESDNVPVILEALQCLLEDSLHSSALLAPLTLDVEQTATNPLRRRLVKALQSLLQGPVSHRACTCLISLIEASDPAGDATEINLSELESFLSHSIRLGRLEKQRDALELLRVVLNMYPSTSTSLSKLLIGDRIASSKSGGAPCCHCRYRQVSILLDLLHDASDDDRVAAAIPCIEELLRTMPLSLWLGDGMGTELLHFGRRTSTALVSLLRVTQCRFHYRGLSISTLCPLIHTSLSRIPFSNDEANALTSEAIQLLSSLSRLFMRSRVPELVECFVSCMGGRPRPQGGLTAMSAPMRIWLLSPLSLEFREYLWTSVESREATARGCVRVLCAMAKTLPSAVVPDRTSWERFRQVIVAYTTDRSHQVRLDGMTLLENVLVGRMESGGLPDEVDHDVAVFAASIARASLNDSKAQIRTACLNSYGSMWTSDWLALSAIHGDDGENDLWVHMNGILSCCVRPNLTIFEGEANAGVRSAACKAIGDVCTRYLTILSNDQRSDNRVSDEQAEVFCRSESDTMLVALRDTNAGVRSMAVFAVGNLAQVVRQRKSDDLLIPPASVQPLCFEVRGCLLESNHKVVGNAVRTIGHLLALVFHPPYRESIALEDWDESTFFGDILTILQVKVSSASALESGSQLSWKQRSAAKKHGWGACNALALVLDCDEAASEANVKESEEAILSLVQCIERATDLNEKVVYAAIAAIRKVSEARLSRISDGTGLIGMALAPSLLQLYQTKKSYGPMKTKLLNELQLLVRHLLGVATISDVCHLLKHHHIENRTVEFLYEWMVENSMSSNSFESFALALQRKDLIDDVRLQQKFASRALQLYRSTDGSSAVTTENVLLPIAKKNNEEDEL